MRSITPKLRNVAASLAIAAVASFALTVSAAPAPAHAYTSQKMHGEAVDACSYTTASNWNSYYTSQPNVYGLFFYIGGVEASDCNINPSTGNRITSSYLSALNSAWDVIPIYDSLQSPCINGGSSNTFSTTASTAQSQGTSIGNNTVSAMANYGFTNKNNAVYLDVEAFNGTSACNTTARAFVQGWINSVHAGGYKAGLYTSASNTDTFSGMTTNPDDAWYAYYNGDDTVSPTDGNTTNYISASHWTNDQRVHQWVSHTEGVDVGSDNIQVDYDCFDADANGGSYLMGACHAPSTTHNN